MMEFVSWDDDIPNIWKNEKCSTPPTSVGRVFFACEEILRKTCEVKRLNIKKMKRPVSTHLKFSVAHVDAHVINMGDPQSRNGFRSDAERFSDVTQSFSISISHHLFTPISEQSSLWCHQKRLKDLPFRRGH